MSKPDPLFFSLQQTVIDLSLINRKHYLAKTDRHENDIEHSMTVAMLCWYIHDTYKLDLDIEKILKYALTHDFVERYVGDVSTFATVNERAEKVKLETASLARFVDEFHDFKDMTDSMQTYEDKSDEESLFVWTVDKMQQLIMGNMDAWRPYAEASITYDQFVSKYDELLARSSKYAREAFDGLIRYCTSTYYDQP